MVSLSVNSWIAAGPAQMNTTGPASSTRFFPSSSSSSSAAAAAAPASLRRRSVSTVFDLSAIDIERLKAAFDVLATPEGKLTRAAFAACFGSLLSGLDDADITRAAHVLHKMFDIFDINGDGAVDVAEFLSGLSVLVGG